MTNLRGPSAEAPQKPCCAVQSGVDRTDAETTTTTATTQQIAGLGLGSSLTGAALRTSVAGKPSGSRRGGPMRKDCQSVAVTQTLDSAGGRPH